VCGVEKRRVEHPPVYCENVSPNSSSPRPTGPATPETFTLRDADDVEVFYYVWRAERPRAIIHVSHGAGDHARRYDELARHLVAAGYTVVADDHRGHGQTGLGHLGLSHLGPGSTRAATRSVQAVGERIRAENPGVPLVMIGHSWGSLMAQKIVGTTDIYAGFVLSGTSLAMPGVLNGGDLNKRWRGPDATGLEWLSRDPAARERFAADPLTFDIAVTPVWTLRQALAFLGRPAKKMSPTLPVLIQGGSDDSLGGTRGMTLLQKAYRRRAGLTDVTLMIYPGARHEIYNETNKLDIIRDLVGWLDARFPRA